MHVEFRQEKTREGGGQNFQDDWYSYRIYPKYLDTVNVQTPSFFLKRHLFYVPYISGHIPNRVFLLSINVWTQKNMSLTCISYKTSIFNTRIFCIFALFTCVSVSVVDKLLCPVCF